MRSARGQASVEYVALVSLVVAVLTAAVALTSGGLGPRLAYAIERGLCAVMGSACPAPPKLVADLPPCPLSRRTKAENLNVDVAVVHLGQGLSLVRETYSDGHVDVTFVDGQSLGLTGTLGAGFHIGKPPAAGDAAQGASGQAEAVFTAGRRWTFPSSHAADAFISRYGNLQTLTGRAIDDVKRDCFFCHWVGLARPEHPPPPASDYEQLGGRLSASALLGAKRRGLAPSGELTGALGVRHDASGAQTYYFQAGAAGAASLFLRTGTGRTAAASATVGVTVDPAGRPTALSLTGAATSTEESSRRTLGRLERGRGQGVVHELELTVPLGAPGARPLLDAVLRGLSVAHVGELPGAIERVAAWGAANAIITRRTYALEDSRGGVEAAGRLGVKAGAGVSTSTRGLRLVGVETRLPGLPFRPRADCLAV